MTEREVDLYKVQAKVVNGAYERGLRVKDVGDDTAPWLVAGLRVVEKKAGEVSREDMVKIDENEKGISLPDPWFQGLSLFKF